MEILETRIMRGPNCWSLRHHQLIVMNVVMEDWEIAEGELAAGDMLAMVALQLQRQAGIDCSYKNAETTDQPLVIRVIVEYVDEQVGLFAVAIAANIAGALLRKEDHDIAEYVRMVQERWDVPHLPTWSERLGQKEHLALQLSPRGGELHCALRDGEVRLAGRCALYMEGSIHI